jgi:hypothetical protein
LGRVECIRRGCAWFGNDCVEHVPFVETTTIPSPPAPIPATSLPYQQRQQPAATTFRTYVVSLTTNTPPAQKPTPVPSVLDKDFTLNTEANADEGSGHGLEITCNSFFFRHTIHVHLNSSSKRYEFSFLHFLLNLVGILIFVVLGLLAAGLAYRVYIRRHVPTGSARMRDDDQVTLNGI